MSEPLTEADVRRALLTGFAEAGEIHIYVEVAYMQGDTRRYVVEFLNPEDPDTLVIQLWNRYYPYNSDEESEIPRGCEQEFEYEAEEAPITISVKRFVEHINVWRATDSDLYTDLMYEAPGGRQRLFPGFYTGDDELIAELRATPLYCEDFQAHHYRELLQMVSDKA